MPELKRFLSPDDQGKLGALKEKLVEDEKNISATDKKADLSRLNKIPSKKTLKKEGVFSALKPDNASSEEIEKLDKKRKHGKPLYSTKKSDNKNDYENTRENFLKNKEEKIKKLERRAEDVRELEASRALLHSKLLKDMEKLNSKKESKGAAIKKVSSGKQTRVKDSHESKNEAMYFKHRDKLHELLEKNGFTKEQIKELEDKDRALIIDEVAKLDQGSNDTERLNKKNARNLQYKGGVEFARHALIHEFAQNDTERAAIEKLNDYGVTKRWREATAELGEIRTERAQVGERIAQIRKIELGSGTKSPEEKEELEKELENLEKRQVELIRKETGETEKAFVERKQTERPGLLRMIENAVKNAKADDKRDYEYIDRLKKDLRELDRELAAVGIKNEITPAETVDVKKEMKLLPPHIETDEEKAVVAQALLERFNAVDQELQTLAAKQGKTAEDVQKILETTLEWQKLFREKNQNPLIVDVKITSQDAIEKVVEKDSESKPEPDKIFEENAKRQVLENLGGELSLSRTTYFELYKQFTQKRGFWKNAKTMLLGGTFKSEDIAKKDPELALRLEEAKAKYNTDLVKYGNEMLAQGKTREEIFEQIVVKEAQLRKEKEVKLVPENVKNILTKGFVGLTSWYTKIPKYPRMLLSTAIATGIIYSAGTVGVAGAAAYGANRLVRSVAGGLIGQLAVGIKNKLFGNAEKGIKKIAAEHAAKLQQEAGQEPTINLDALAKMRQMHNEKIQKEFNMRAKHLITDAAIRIGAGIGTSIELGKYMEAHGGVEKWFQHDTPKDIGHTPVTPNHPPEIPKTPEPTINPDALAHKGDSIWRIVKRQLEHDPKLAHDSGYDVATNKDAFINKLLVDKGYIEHSGAGDVRILDGGGAAYQLEVHDGNIQIHEFQNGQSVEIHGSNTPFEGKDIEKGYEYDHEGKLIVPKTEVVNTNDPGITPTPPPEVDPGITPTPPQLVGSTETLIGKGPELLQNTPSDKQSMLDALKHNHPDQQPAYVINPPKPIPDQYIYPGSTGETYPGATYPYGTNGEKLSQGISFMNPGVPDYLHRIYESYTPGYVPPVITTETWNSVANMNAYDQFHNHYFMSNHFDDPRRPFFEWVLRIGVKPFPGETYGEFLLRVGKQ